MNLLSALDFSLCILDVKRFEGSGYNDTLMDVAVTCNGFAGRMQMEIDYLELCAFIQDLKAMYDKLSGVAQMKEPFGKAYIRFACDRMGYVTISGELEEMHNHLKFETTIDQTYMKAFIDSLDSII